MTTHEKWQWFVEPTEDKTRSNEIIGKNLQATEGFFHKCSDGKKHYLWDCTFEQAESLYKSQRSLEINVRVWNKQGDGQIKPHTFLLKRRKSAIINIGKKLARIQASRKKPANETEPIRPDER